MSKKRGKDLRYMALLSVVILLVIILLAVVLSGKEQQLQSKKLQIRIFLHSTNALDREIENELIHDLSYASNTNLTVNFIKDSMTSEDEIKEDIIQLCFQKYHHNKMPDFIICRNKDMTKDYKDCFKNLDMHLVDSCINSNEGTNLLLESFKESEDITYSPAVFVEGKRFTYLPKSDAFKRYLCSLSPSPLCKSLLPTKPVRIIVINDKRCSSCNVDKEIDKLKLIFPSLKVETKDYSDAKELYKKAGLVYLPAILFDSDIKNNPNFVYISRFLVRRGQYYVFKTESRFNPNNEICNNKIDDNQNGLIDCSDPDCGLSPVCRKEIPEKLDLFIMSDCPYSREAVLSAEEILKNFDGKIDFNIHYVAKENAPYKFFSLRGDYEVEEDIRQLCIKKHYPDVWFKYIVCRSRNGIRSKWRLCSDGINAAIIDNCVNSTEGKELLSSDIKLANSLGITKSPTWLINNKYLFSGVDANAVKDQFCMYNEMRECNKRIKSMNLKQGTCG